MFIVGVLSWWYGAGWLQRVAIVRERLASTVDYFSIGLLAKTLFSPYRQISAGKVRGSLGVHMRAFVDRLISRVIGSIVRAIIILIGSIAILLYCIVGILTVILWAFVPLMPIIGAILFATGWVPSWN